MLINKLKTTFESIQIQSQFMDSSKSQVTQALAHVQVLDYLMPNQPGLYIKWSPTNMTSKDVYDVLTELNLGLIDVVRFRPILNQQTQQEGTSFTIFIKEWFRNSNADQARLKLISDPNNFITVNYEQNKYWKIYPNRINNNNNKPNPKPFQPSITFNDPPRERQPREQQTQPQEQQQNYRTPPHKPRQTQQPPQTPKKIEKMKYIPKSIQVPKETAPRETTQTPKREPKETTPNTAPAEKKYSWADNNSDDEDN